MTTPQYKRDQALSRMKQIVGPALRPSTTSGITSRSDLVPRTKINMSPQSLPAPTVSAQRVEKSMPPGRPGVFRVEKSTQPNPGPGPSNPALQRQMVDRARQITAKAPMPPSRPVPVAPDVQIRPPSPGRGVVSKLKR